MEIEAVSDSAKVILGKKALNWVRLERLESGIRWLSCRVRGDRTGADDELKRLKRLPREKKHVRKMLIGTILALERAKENVKHPLESYALDIFGRPKHRGARKLFEATRRLGDARARFVSVHKQLENLPRLISARRDKIKRDRVDDKERLEKLLVMYRAKKALADAKPKRAPKPAFVEVAPGVLLDRKRYEAYKKEAKGLVLIEGQNGKGWEVRHPTGHAVFYPLPLQALEAELDRLRRNGLPDDPVLMTELKKRYGGI